ncbi:MAG: hypothetical protein M3N50_09275 [Pseudomonadota bacterium]|nr:hypothetical protein [Pseudomonadota bacterium]
MNTAQTVIRRDNEAAERPASLVARAKSLAPWLAQRSAQINQDRMASKEVVEAFREAGFLSYLRPKMFGGQEGDYGVFVQVLDELAQGCTSSAWVCSVLGEHAWFISCFPEQAQIDVWGQDNNACAAASFMPRPVTAVSGGYQVAGTWSFASGCDHAQWFLLGGIGQQPMMMLVPASDVQIIDDWNVLGLRGTGSKSVRLRDAFVPAHRTLAYQDLMAGTSPGAKVHPDYYLCRTPQQLLAPYSLPAVLLGATQKALDVFAGSIRDRKLPTGQLIAEQPAMQMAAAEAAAEIDMIRAMIRHQVRTGVADMRASRPVDLQKSLDGRRDFTHLAHRMVAVVLKLCAMSGSRWVFDGDPLQTILRDVITGSSHRGGSWDGLLGSGRAVFGLPPLSTF